MKTKFLISVAIFFALTGNSFAAKNASSELPQTSSSADTKDIKTFDFEQIFAEANQYYQDASDWKKIKCTPHSAFVCTKRECPKLTIYKGAYMILDRENSTVALCRDKICSYLQAKFEQTGVFVNVQVREEMGMHVKILGNNRYTEISMVGLDAYMTNGVCEPFDDKKDAAKKAKK